MAERARASLAGLDLEPASPGGRFFRLFGCFPRSSVQPALPQRLVGLDRRHVLHDIFVPSFRDLIVWAPAATLPVYADLLDLSFMSPRRGGACDGGLLFRRLRPSGKAVYGARLGRARLGRALGP